MASKQEVIKAVRSRLSSSLDRDTVTKMAKKKAAAPKAAKKKAAKKKAAAPKAAKKKAAKKKAAAPKAAKKKKPAQAAFDRAVRQSKVARRGAGSFPSPLGKYMQGARNKRSKAKILKRGSSESAW